MLANVPNSDLLTAEKVTLIGVLLFGFGAVVWGLLTERWVPGWLYRRECENSKKWEQVALTAQAELRDNATAIRALVETLQQKPGGKQ